MDVMASITDTELVIAAKNTRTKNSKPSITPPFICANTFGNVINISPAPPLDIPASPLNTYTAGITIIPASKAIIVSNISI